MVHYARITNIFYFYSGCSSTYPMLSMNDFTSFAKLTGILDHDVISLAALDLALVATCMSSHEYVNSARLDMTRYEFLEMIVRVANEMFRETKVVKTTSQAIEKLLESLVYPNARYTDGAVFRNNHCYDHRVNKLLQLNQMQIQKVFDSFTHAKKKHITLAECQTYVRRVGLNINEMMIGAIYAECLMTIVDTIRDLQRPNQMKYVEFLVFLCRVAHEHYQQTEHAQEPLCIKLDQLLPAFLAYISLQPTFLFGLKFSRLNQHSRQLHSNPDESQPHNFQPL